MVRAQIVGATGYGGLGIVELMLCHPDFEIVSAVARQEAGRRLDEIYPHLASRCELTIESVDATPIGAIDNLLKGQSGEAMQNLNLMFGLAETAGLDRRPLHP